MIVRRGYRFRVYPTPEQVARLTAWESSLRFLWNLANEQYVLWLARPRCDRRCPNRFNQGRELTELRAELPWLADVPRNLCEAVLADLEKAWQRCFQRLSQAPRWKKRSDGARLSETHAAMWRLDSGTLHFPKLDPMRVVQHRVVEGLAKSATIVRDVDQWFVAIQSEVEIIDPSPRVAPVVALDRGIANLVADSDGNLVANPQHLKRALARIARAQRVLSRRKKGSANREKAKTRVAKLHRTVRRQRSHATHELSAKYAKSHGVVVVERLNVAGMVRGNLGRSINDAGWSMLVDQLRYKLAWSGGTLVEVPAAYSSQTCAVCGHVDADSRRSQSEFACTGCGVVDHADLNAAKVLKIRAGESPVTGCGGVSVRRPKKQQLRVVRRKAVKAA